MLYTDDLPLAAKLETVAREVYAAAGIALSDAAASDLKGFTQLGYGQLPVCIAKTQFSFSGDPAKLGAPSGHVLDVREVRLAAGAGFVVAICGNVMTMPGLPRHPAANEMGLDSHGNIVGLA